MFTRRAILSGIAIFAAGTVVAQGKKSSDGGNGNSITRVIGIDGSYDARGLNSDGTEYEGRAEIVQQGTEIEITWFVQGDTIPGRGRIDGRVLTVNWGSDFPVYYVILENGELHGTWDNGLALEKLTPR